MLVNGYRRLIRIDINVIRQIFNAVYTRNTNIRRSAVITICADGKTSLATGEPRPYVLHVFRVVQIRIHRNGPRETQRIHFHRLIIHGHEKLRGIGSDNATLANRVKWNVAPKPISIICFQAFALVHTDGHLIMPMRRDVSIIRPVITIMMHLQIYGRIFRVGKGEDKFTKISSPSNVGGYVPFHKMIVSLNLRKVDVLCKHKRIVLRDTRLYPSFTCSAWRSVGNGRFCIRHVVCGIVHEEIFALRIYLIPCLHRIFYRIYTRLIKYDFLQRRNRTIGKTNNRGCLIRFPVFGIISRCHGKRFFVAVLRFNQTVRPTVCRICGRIGNDARRCGCNA